MRVVLLPRLIPNQLAVYEPIENKLYHRRDADFSRRRIGRL